MYFKPEDIAGTLLTVETDSS